MRTKCQLREEITLINLRVKFLKNQAFYKRNKRKEIKRGLNQISEKNKTSCFFLLGQHLFLGNKIEKEKKERKRYRSQIATRNTTRATKYRRGCCEISNIVGIA